MCDAVRGGEGERGDNISVNAAGSGHALHQRIGENYPSCACFLAHSATQ